MTDTRRHTHLLKPNRTVARVADSLGLKEMRLDQLWPGGQHKNVVFSSAIYRASGNRSESADFYSVLLPLSGRLFCDHVDDESPVVAGRGVVASPTQPMRLYASAHAQLAMIQIERVAIEWALSRLLGRAPTFPILFEPAIDVRTGAMRDWYQLARHGLGQTSRHEQALMSPGVTRAVEELVVVSLLWGQPNNYTSALRNHETSNRDR